MDLMDYRRQIIANSPHLSHAEGAVASFANGTDLPLKSLLVDIEPVQSGSGDPSPTNIRPIIGWDAAKVTRTGKNLLGGLPMAQAIVNAVGNATYSKQVSDDTGDYVTIKASSYTNNKVFTSGVKFKSNTQYTVILKVTRNIVGTSVSSNISVRYTDGTYKIITFAESTGTEIVTAAFVTDGAKTVKHIETSWGGGTSKIYYDECGIFGGVLTASDFVPYTGTSLNIQLGRTVYGGTLNVLTGELVAYPYYASYNGETLTGRWVSDRDKYVSEATPTIGAQVVDMSGTGTTYTLDPQTVRSLVGQNNIFADTGNTSLDYWAHP